MAAADYRAAHAAGVAAWQQRKATRRPARCPYRADRGVRELWLARVWRAGYLAELLARDLDETGAPNPGTDTAHPPTFAP